MKDENRGIHWDQEMLSLWINFSLYPLQSCNSLTSWQSWLIEPQSLGDSISQILIISQFLGLIAHEERYAWSLIIPHTIIGPSRGRIICHISKHQNPDSTLVWEGISSMVSCFLFQGSHETHFAFNLFSKLIEH